MPRDVFIVGKEEPLVLGLRHKCGGREQFILLRIANQKQNFFLLCVNYVLPPKISQVGNKDVSGPNCVRWSEEGFLSIGVCLLGVFRVA